MLISQKCLTNCIEFRVELVHIATELLQQASTDPNKIITHYNTNVKSRSQTDNLEAACRLATNIVNNNTKWLKSWFNIDLQQFEGHRMFQTQIDYLKTLGHEVEAQ